jgi:uncharacterized protein YbjT (DUF2867 family)
MRIAIAGSTGLVGSKVLAAATAAGHEVVELAREHGIDLTVANGLADRLAGVEAVIDVTQGPLEEPAASEFFTTVARNLGEAASAAGVTRVVTLSIVGIDEMTDYGYYAAKVAQEQTTKAYAPDPHILGATQFLDFPGQMLSWYRDGDTVTVPTMKTQPVSVDEIVRLLIALADGSESRQLVELAGPKVEDLDDLVRQVVARRGEPVSVETTVTNQAMADGACLPGPDAIIAGPDFATWLAQQD